MNLSLAVSQMCSQAAHTRSILDIDNHWTCIGYNKGASIIFWLFFIDINNIVWFILCVILQFKTSLNKSYRGKITGIIFLTDTGSDVSIIPYSNKANRSSAGNLKCYAANSAVIDMFGERTITFNVNLRRTFTWTLILANTAGAIIRAYFLCQFNLLVDIHNGKLVDNITHYLYQELYRI